MGLDLFQPHTMDGWMETFHGLINTYYDGFLMDYGHCIDGNISDQFTGCCFSNTSGPGVVGGLPAVAVWTPSCLSKER